MCICVPITMPTAMTVMVAVAMAATMSARIVTAKKNWCGST